MKGKFLIITFYSLSLIFIVICIIINFNISNKSFDFNNTGRYITTISNDISQDFQGCFLAEENMSFYQIYENNYSNSIRYFVDFEEYIIEIASEDEIICEYGKIYNKGDVVASHSDGSFSYADRPCMCVGICEDDNTKLKFYYLPSTKIQISLGAEYDFDNISFFYGKQFEDSKRLEVLNIEYLYERKYQITLSPLLLDNCLVNNDYIFIYLVNNQNENYFLIPKNTIFNDYNGTYIKRYFYNSSYGYLYEKVYIDTQYETLDNYCFFGDYLGDKLLYNNEVSND